MRKYLDAPKIDYVLTHLKFRCDFPFELNQRMVFLKQEELVHIPKNCIVFPLSNHEKVLSYRIGTLPIFYPVFPNETKHSFNKNGSLVFSHDIIQQIFCLQTLFYEQELDKKDKLGRIIPETTINSKLDILNKPIVDYLFALIVDVLEDYCYSNNIPFKRISLLSNHIFLLSHDVDRVNTYSFYNTANTLKKLALTPNVTSSKVFFKHLSQLFKIKKRENPLWDFPLLNEIEKEFHLKSTYYFLNQGKLHQDAYYSLSSPKILKLINEIESNQHEIGLHLTIAGNNDENIVRKNLTKLNKVIKQKIQGVRSHWLRFDPIVTPDILDNLKIKYDSSIGHYSHEGFRSGTCLPYKLFSYKQNKILNIWEIPLIYMDCMILDYQNISKEEAFLKLSNILNEVVKYKGVFTVLWHNGNFANKTPYNRYDFYRNLIKMILDTQAINITAKSLIESLEENN